VARFMPSICGEFWNSLYAFLDLIAKRCQTYEKLLQKNFNFLVRPLPLDTDGTIGLLNGAMLFHDRCVEDWNLIFTECILRWTESGRKKYQTHFQVADPPMRKIKLRRGIGEFHKVWRLLQKVWK